MKVLLFALFLIISANVAKSEEISIHPRDTVMVELVSIIPNIITDVRYATDDNFTGQVLYPSDRVFLRRIVADSLRSVQEKLKILGYYLIVFDGYRPLSVQKTMWKILPDPKYVADPAVGSKHNRGASVDITLMDSTGAIVDMGTEFDDFTEKSGHGYTNLPKETLQNRKLLKDIMIEAGFIPFDTEWWHYDFNLWEHFSFIEFDIY